MTFYGCVLLCKFKAYNDLIFFNEFIRLANNEAQGEL
jgi:hypothetical protein